MTLQDDVFAFLERPQAHGGHAVRRIDTHGAAVFLAGDRVLKVKRAVRFPFLDYSTLEKRKAACEAEIEANRGFAPAIYRGVVAITRQADGALAIGGDGEPAEYAVDMQRFDEEQTLDHIADRGGIDDGLADALGRVVAEGHAKAPAVAAEPWIDALDAYIGQNDEACRAWPDLFSPGDVDALTRASRAAFAEVRPLLSARGKNGLVRRGHGDLHLGNIALVDGRPMLFDAIEFDPLVAAGDVLYDLAFLLMDLIERDLAGPANIVFNRYLVTAGRADDLDALAALPLFLSVRAAIRAKVTAARLDNPKTDRKAVETSARAYFELALRLIAPPAPMLVAVGGLSGTGKSVLARGLASHLAPAPGAVVLRSDIERKRLAGVSETEKLPPESYTPESSRRVYAALEAQAARVLAAGHSAIIDAVFADPAERADAAAVAARAGRPFHGLFLTADLATRIERVGARVGDASDADDKVVRHQAGYDLGRLDWKEVDASGTPDDTLAHAKRAMALPD